eukprot:SAG25_NODE_672_length_6012_cov_14.256046_2_plen_153_part_00
MMLALTARVASLVWGLQDGEDEPQPEPEQEEGGAMAEQVVEWSPGPEAATATAGAGALESVAFESLAASALHNMGLLGGAGGDAGGGDGGGGARLAAAAAAADCGGGESFMRVHWVAVPKALRARRVNRRRRRWGAAHGCRTQGGVGEGSRG